MNFIKCFVTVMKNEDRKIIPPDDNRHSMLVHRMLEDQNYIGTGPAQCSGG